MISITDLDSEAPEPVLDLAQVTPEHLISGAINKFGQVIHLNDASDVVLADIARRHIISEENDSQVKNQLQEFNIRDIVRELGLKLIEEDIKKIGNILRDKKLLHSSLDENGVVFPSNGAFFLSYAGLIRGKELIIGLVAIIDQASGLQKSDNVIRVDSVRWTGLSNISVSHRNAALIVSLIDKALDELSEYCLDNLCIAQSRAFLLAARALAEAPDPPSELIWQLIGKAADTAGLLALFYAIFSAVLS